MDKLLEIFSLPFTKVLKSYEKEISVSREIRIRAGHPILLCGEQSVSIPGFYPNAKQMEELLLCFCGQALYAHEEQLMQGYVTLPGGHRVGVCGRMQMSNGKPTHFADVQSMNIRIARQIPCDRRALPILRTNTGVRSSLIVSPPGFGKTTMLRDIARTLSCDGIQLAIADERGELAACLHGKPQLDVGPCTDVMDGMPKAEAMRLLVRALSPQVIVSDEIGSEADAQAIMEARRCGVAVLCSAHGATLRDVKAKPSMRVLFQEGIFDRILILGKKPGQIQAVYDSEGRPC